MDQTLKEESQGLKALWWLTGGAIAVAGSTAVALLLLPVYRAPWPELAEGTFYVSGFVNTGVLIRALVVQNRLRRLIHHIRDHEEALWRWHHLSMHALIPLAAGGFFASIAAASTGEWIQLTFLLTSIAFCVVFRPSDRRITKWILTHRTEG